MSSRNDRGYSFSFKLPSEGLALRGVALNDDGTPELIFDASLKVPTLSEEDVGIACRLACEEVRPEFFYYAIPIHHPYHGRQYKYYCPGWLRGTSIGELLSEADWTMKCLNIGARSDKTKERFWVWQEKSQLKGLADGLDFPDDKFPGRILMSCDSVAVQKCENEMTFVGEPKMRITDEGNSTYTKYISEIYPSVAYYDEPLFLKIQELIKLILAAEWLKEKGVRFSRPWMMDCSVCKSQEAPMAVEVKSKRAREEDVHVREAICKLEKQLPQTSHREDLGPFTVDVVVEKTVTDSSFEAKVTTTAVPTSLASPKVQVTTTRRVAVNDYDMLYRGLDPNMPIIPGFPGQQKEIVPNVGSWSELFSETVPRPQTWILPYRGNKLVSDEITTATGGVTTSNIPVTEVASARSHVQVSSGGAVKEKVHQEGRFTKYKYHNGGRLGVQATQGKGKCAVKVPEEMVPRQDVVPRPENDVTSKTDLTRYNRSHEKHGGRRRAVGYTDSGSGEMVVCDEEGRVIQERQGMRQYAEQHTVTNNKPVKNSALPNLQPLIIQDQPVSPQFAGSTNDLFSPTSSASSKDSGFSSLPGSHSELSLEGEPSKPEKEEDEDTPVASSDSGNESDDMATN